MTILRCCFALLLTIVLPGPAAAQTPDSAARAKAVDSLAPVRKDTVPSGNKDTATPCGAKKDSVAPAAPAQPAPPDPSLVAACKPGPKGEPVAHLLLVIFRARTPPADQAAAAAAVKGWLAGEAPTGETYVALPGGVPARAAADKIILSRGVQEVSDMDCP
jgi:hypothetical protein